MMVCLTHSLAHFLAAESSVRMGEIEKFLIELCRSSELSSISLCR